jgi:integrase
VALPPVRKRGNSWNFVVDLGPDPITGKRRQKRCGGFKTKAEGERERNRLLGQVVDGTLHTSSARTLADFLLEEWLRGKRQFVSESSARTYTETLTYYVLPHIGEIRLSDLSAGQIQRLYARLAESGRKRDSGPLSATTIMQVHRVLRTALSDAAKWGYLANNPAALATPARPRSRTQKADTCWTRAQVAKFESEVVDHRLFALWQLLLWSGLRRGEALGLEWDHVDLGAGRLAVRQSLSMVGTRPTVGPPKTESSRRDVELLPTTVKALRRWHSRQAEERLAVGERYVRTDFVFTRPHGGPLHPNTVSLRWSELVRNCGLPEIRLHDTRHTHATMMRRWGRSEDRVAAAGTQLGEDDAGRLHPPHPRRSPGGGFAVGGDD